MNFDEIDSFSDLISNLGSLLQGSVWLIIAATSVLISLRDRQRKAGRTTANKGAPTVTSRTAPESPYRTGRQSSKDAYAKRPPAASSTAPRPKSIWDQAPIPAERPRDDGYARRAPAGSSAPQRPRSMWDGPSLFDETADDEPLKWGSAFDDHSGERKWGFDESEWGSSFGPKKKSEPKITTG